jgi:hypothetical protein
VVAARLLLWLLCNARCTVGSTRFFARLEATSAGLENSLHVTVAFPPRLYMAARRRPPRCGYGRALPATRSSQI